MDNVKFNKCQTPLEELGLEKQPQEVQEEKDYIVYKHTSPSGKVYVGITKLPPSLRWNNGKGYKRCKLFYRAIQKYGWNNLTHDIVLKGISKLEAVYAEKYLIKWYKIHRISYNITDGGESTVGFHMPKDAKRKIAKFASEFHKKPVLQYDTKGRFIMEYPSAAEASEALGFGKTSVSNCASGIKRENVLHGFIFIYKDCEDTLSQRLDLCKNHWKMHKIAQFQDGILVNVFDSIREAERITGINRTCIRKNIQGKFKRAGEYTWKRLKEEEVYGS